MEESVELLTAKIAAPEAQPRNADLERIEPPPMFYPGGNLHIWQTRMPQGLLKNDYIKDMPQLYRRVFQLCPWRNGMPDLPTNSW